MCERTPTEERGCFGPFVNRVRAKLEEGGSLGEATRFIQRAVRHDRYSAFKLNVGKFLNNPALNTLEFTTNHAVAINTATLTVICIYEWLRHNGLPLPGTEVVLGPLVAAGASSSGGKTVHYNENVDVYVDKDGSGTVFFHGKSESPHIDSHLEPREVDELLGKKR